MTKRYMITLAYDGTNFAGFQAQPKQRTVQSAKINEIDRIGT